MSSLTDRRKKEIEMLYRRMKKRPSKVLLNIFLDDNFFSQDPTLPKYISQLLKQKEGVESYIYTEGSNNITATARWTESEAQYRVDDLRETRGIKSVQAKILYPA